MNNEIKILEAVPEDAEGTVNVYYKTWLDTYPNEEFGVTREDDILVTKSGARMPEMDMVIKAS